ncbi:MAG TPA: hypothetical protein VN698_02255 [Bacteroidia bacterium]|nr:hypothetical protein [Bacteroidia bacterium]
MTEINKTPAIIINLIAVAIMLHIAGRKTYNVVGVVAIMYIFLVIVNVVLWLTFALLKNPASKIYRYTTIWLVVLFIPFVILATIW